MDALLAILPFALLLLLCPLMMLFMYRGQDHNAGDRAELLGLGGGGPSRSRPKPDIDDRTSLRTSRALSRPSGGGQFQLSGSRNGVGSTGRGDATSKARCTASHDGRDERPRARADDRAVAGGCVAR